MRVIAGKARRTPLKTVEGMGTRPTTDRIKETLFNMLQMQLADCRFLDLFSGSGGIGIEALSRGAAFAVFVEADKKAAACIKENLKSTKLEAEGRVECQDVITYLERVQVDQPFDLVFMDPPYNLELEKKVLEVLSHSDVVNENTVIIVEASLQTSFDYLETLGYETLKIKKYKTNVHMFVRRK